MHPLPVLHQVRRANHRGRRDQKPARGRSPRLGGLWGPDGCRQDHAAGVLGLGLDPQRKCKPVLSAIGRGVRERGRRMGHGRHDREPCRRRQEVNALYDHARNEAHPPARPRRCKAGQRRSDHQRSCPHRPSHETHPSSHVLSHHMLRRDPQRRGRAPPARSGGHAGARGPSVDAPGGTGDHQGSRDADTSTKWLDIGGTALSAGGGGHTATRPDAFEAGTLGRREASGCLAQGMAH